MILYPAIDILDGRVVRLDKGEFDAVTEYGDDPVAAARRFREAGADWVHVVDLSGARDGTRQLGGSVAAIADTGLKLQTGGGVRSRRDIERLLDAGASRVVIGSLAATAPNQVIEWLDELGGDRLTLAFDVRPAGDGYQPAVKGWTEAVDTTLDEVLAAYASRGLRHALVTDISRDGQLSGPNLELYARLACDYPDVAWQASGGVASLDDLIASAKSGAAGAICGKALYEGRFTVEEALACLQDA
ncbi:1-(5-phosphoribosyl)-5-[(5-phosphoribosylamino)methylideneamino]imidazole-4-carboxamide isomerase [Maricaulis sp. CAU 1757]